MAKRTRLVEAAVAAVLLLGCAGAVMAQDAASAVAARKGAMKAIGGASAALRGTDVAAMKAAGKTINDNLKTFGSSLAAGTGPESGQQTRAKAEIWSDATGFKTALDAALAASATLAAASTDDAAKAAAAAMGGTCAGCHGKYRGPAA
ncbi:hypothetical protein BH11PSE2_BH11PSE2_13360 [soil metagenome]